jgi:hypothetical protein
MRKGVGKGKDTAANGRRAEDLLSRKTEIRRMARYAHDGQSDTTGFCAGTVELATCQAVRDVAETTRCSGFQLATDRHSRRGAPDRVAHVIGHQQRAGVVYGYADGPTQRMACAVDESRHYINW